MNKKKKINHNKEIRLIDTSIELRALEEGDSQEEYITGYALKFEKWSEKLGWGFKEIISRGALDNTDFTDVVALFNHDINKPLARNSIESGTGSLILEVDDIGLRFKFIPTKTSYAQDLIENMRAGLIEKCSFAFQLDYSDKDIEKWEWDYDTGLDYDKRRINKISKISDISIVVQPAYSDTESIVNNRCLEQKQTLQQERNRELRKHKLALELELLN